jgi:hypothetical protein
VRLSNDARKCVVFLGIAEDGDPDRFEPLATGFFITWTAFTGPGRSVGYLVTAKHCVTGALSDPFDIRFNDKDGSFVFHIEQPEWHFHSDPSVDVALLELEPPKESDNDRFPDRLAVTHGSVPETFGLGDLVYTVGLFTWHRGRSRNIPLVHAGHIAALPQDDRVLVRDWDEPNNRAARKQIEAFVVQCPTMPGSSGSPVFVRRSMPAAHHRHWHEPESGDNYTPTNWPPNGYSREVYLLGLWHGAWEINEGDVIGMTAVRHPAGYGIVVPAYKILEVLDVPKLKERREKLIDRYVQAEEAGLPIADSAPNPDEIRRDTVLHNLLSTPPAPRKGKK